MQIATKTSTKSESLCDQSAADEGSAVSPPELLLLREMTHRIKNELTSTIGLVSLLATRSDDCRVKLALTEVAEHLYDQAGIYRALQMPTADMWADATEYLRSLCQSVSRARLKNNGIELVLVEHPVHLSSMQCWKLGLIVSELITNSCRHAFGGRAGSIRIEFKEQGSRAECVITDDGNGQRIAHSGHSVEIVRQLAEALGGEIDLRFGEDGAIATLAFPILIPSCERRAVAVGM